MCKGLPVAVPNETDTAPRGTVDSSSIDMDFARKAIAPRLQALAEAQNAHIRAAQVEASKSKNIHALTRHGFQTGWAGQLLRVCTKLTPDQEYDPLGVLPLEQKLAEHTTGKVVYADGKPTGERVQVKMKHRTGGGVAAGMFYNPEIQDELMKRSLALARTEVASFPECEVRLVNGRTEWRRYSFVHVHLIRIGGSGVAFAKGEKFQPVPPEVVVQAINDFMSAARPAPNQPPRFRCWGDLLNFLHVTQILRNGCRTEISVSGVDPCVMTMMPETVDEGHEGFAPTSVVLEKKERADFVGCRWTGGLRNPKTGQSTSKLVPKWAEAFK
jgi:hypothetical protein